MIDLHCHILPDMDDGAQDLDYSVHMLEEAKKCGINTIAATSHYIPEKAPFYDGKFKALQPLAEKNGVRLIPGCEYDLRYLKDIEAEKLRPLGNSSYILVDMNQKFIARSMVNVFFSLKLAGWDILFAHPERMLGHAEIGTLIDLLKENDIKVQVDSGSITGRYGHLAQKNAWRIMDTGYCHVLGNDAHKAHHFQFEACRDQITRRYGSIVFDLLTEKNPQAILEGGNLETYPPRRTFWGSLKGIFSKSK